MSKISATEEEYELADGYSEPNQVVSKITDNQNENPYEVLNVKKPFKPKSSSNSRWIIVNVLCILMSAAGLAMGIVVLTSYDKQTDVTGKSV